MLKDVSLAHALYVVLNVGQLADLRLQHAVRVRGVQGDVDGGNVVLLVHSITTLVESPRINIRNQNNVKSGISVDIIYIYRCVVKKRIIPPQK